MPFYFINKEPVFLSWRRYKELEEEAFKGKDSTWIISSRISGTRETKERSKLIFNLLHEKFRKDPKGFHSRWVEFDLIGEEARSNLWDLMHDYCQVQGP